MKIAILTLPLNTNFGGILQAYALQRYLVKEGHEVIHIEKKNKESLVYWSTFRFYRWWCGRRLIGQLLKLNRTRDINNYKYDIRKRTSSVRSFVNKFISRRVVDKFETLENEFDCIIVGSDQIWRPRYYPDVGEAFLAFAEQWEVRKITYAPSFGVQHWEFDENQTKQCGKLLEGFDAISVREDQGVEMCEEKFGVKVSRLLDPTMLLKRADYESLIGNEVKTKANQLTTYILDMNTDKRDILDKVRTEKCMDCVELGLAEYATPNSQTNISIEKWLQEFMQAEFIFTDSFHGCVFAILFHKPFLVYGNKDRGLSRFTTLLQLFGLEDRMVFDMKTAMKAIGNRIDWERVDLVIASERKKSRDFFQSVGVLTDDH